MFRPTATTLLEEKPTAAVTTLSRGAPMEGLDGARYGKTSSMHLPHDING